MVISKILPAVVSAPILKDNNVRRNDCFDCPKVMLLESCFEAVDDLSDIRFWIAALLCEEGHNRDQQHQDHVQYLHDSHVAISPLSLCGYSTVKTFTSAAPQLRGRSLNLFWPP